MPLITLLSKRELRMKPMPWITAPFAGFNEHKNKLFKKCISTKSAYYHNNSIEKKLFVKSK